VQYVGSEAPGSPIGGRHIQGVPGSERSQNEPACQLGGAKPGPPPLIPIGSKSIFVQLYTGRLLHDGVTFHCRRVDKDLIYGLCCASAANGRTAPATL